MVDFKTPIKDLSRVGKITAKRLQHLGLFTAGDLLYYFPFRYEDYRQVILVQDLQEGQLATVLGKLEFIVSKRSWRKRKVIVEALVSDKSGSIRVTWFNQPYITKILHQGDLIFLSGKVQSDMIGSHFVSPTFEKAVRGETKHTARMVPIYSATTGLTQKQIRFLISQIIALSAKTVDWLPADILEEWDMLPLRDALRGIHFPVDEQDLKYSTERLKFDELFLFQLKAELSRLKKTNEKAPQLIFQEKKIKEFVSSLPFVLTNTQKVSAWEILRDINLEKPMNRLLSGDVGSGKTAVAAIVIYNAVLNGYQAVLMVPTEILARQHYNTLLKLLGDKIQIGLLTRSQAEINQNNNEKFKNLKSGLLKKIKNGEVQVVIGTHALLSEKVQFKDVGLIIVDEQHRFGVEQRKNIKDKTDNLSAHFLSMTATPIPRSLALMLYGDLSMSTINEMPIGRKKISTRLVESNNRDKAYNFIRAQVNLGRQVFVICPLIESQTKDESAIEIINYPFFPTAGVEKKSVMTEYKKLSENIFPDLKVDYLHGKLKSVEKEKIMEAFKNKEIDILISTSVVEVGIDMPNASVMMIEGADRFGLAQLHQFRGRVGRADYQSYCFLFTDSQSSKVHDRLKYFETTADGFKLAEKDLEIRGPGEVYGTMQSGLMNLRLAKLTDKEIIKKAKQAAQVVAVGLNKYPSIKQKIKDWEKTVHFE
ncbi:MAG: DNA helicase RecG [Candidatus Magasanikbacteria bacterium CG10_big_fil_rev_8_21_14_0_10_36_32]|uniref:ATP-dependent DNA helicase RecG n=1 Tax=Candidatus Magasanikbacteria bacterium CG10_big_fil_rev_8_21_14_0_10_36_32 TaxID=1974646 RepID=A0A2M6W6L6_9BACT|nr:MAG: DNA helicase RecG [Candidatus Magasanikbacteria bacterium CG10_big_fil_rev_8_21_14_0_10_36_32]